MKFENSYFEPEIQDGFYVPAMVKQAWAAELEVLEEIDKICRKHNIEYFADWGTLLATIRHEGFIPWDDDLDIVMKRADYKRFMEIAQTELSDGFAAYNYKNHEDFWLFLARVVGKPRICFEDEHLQRFHEFPYIAGVDIFVLDYVSRDEDAEQKRDELAMYTLAIADSFGENAMSKEAQEIGFERIERECGVTIPRNLPSSDMRRFLYGVVEELFDRFSEDEADEMTQLFPFGMKNKNFRFPKVYYQKIARLPYENTTMPVPVQYDTVLKKRYGDYMKLVRNAGGHDYPYFEAQHKQLLAVLDFEFPTYKFDEGQLRTERENYKTYIRNCLTNMEQLHENMENDSVLFMQQLTDCQQYAIAMGTLIDEVKGEGTETVTLLEEYCEALFCASQIFETELFEKLKQELCLTFENVKQNVECCILQKKTIVFLPYKAEQWKYVEKIWKKAKSDNNCEVFVVPIPYYYKRYDGSYMGVNYEGDLLPKEVEITEYESVDLSRMQPDVIYIQNPYDEWNQVITVQPQYYSKQLQQFCDKLVYVQSFEVEKFSKENYREFFNMRDYVTVPGVVRADEIILQTDWMRENYIEKLMEFAGIETKGIWEQKIAVAEVDVPTIEDAEQEEGRKRRIVYGINPCFLLQNKEQAIKKLESSFRIFQENKDKIQLIWCPHPMLEDFTKKEAPELWDSYFEMIAKYENEEWIESVGESDWKKIVDSTDAYYGDSERLALEFFLKKKPVMIQDVNI